MIRRRPYSPAFVPRYYIYFPNAKEAPEQVLGSEEETAADYWRHNPKETIWLAVKM